MADLYDLAFARNLAGGDSPAAVLTEKTITANGTYDPADDGADGYSAVTVAVLPPPDYISEGLAFALKPLLNIETISLDQTRRFAITDGMTIEGVMSIASNQTVCRVFELMQESTSKVCSFCLTNNKELDGQIFAADTASWASGLFAKTAMPVGKKFAFSMLIDNVNLVMYLKINDVLAATWDVSGRSTYSAYSSNQFATFYIRKAADRTDRNATYCTLENVHVYSRPLTAQEQTHNFDIAKAEYNLEE